MPPRTVNGYFGDAFKNTGIHIYTENHQSIVRKFLDVGYRQEFAYHLQPLKSRSTRGSERVAVVYKEEVHDRVHVQKDVDADYIWI